LRLAAADAQSDYERLRRRAPRENHELPLASMMLAETNEGGFFFLWFGDCAALIARPGETVALIGESFSKRASEARRVAHLAKQRGLAPTAGVDTPEYQSALRAARNQVNTRADRWAFSPDVRCAEFASAADAAAPEGTHLLLCSDGFFALATDYGRYDVDTLMAACLSRGLKALCEELREVERGDPDGHAYPRFKVSDDATAVLLRLVEQ
jgi:hypothetical protein